MQDWYIEYVFVPRMESKLWSSSSQKTAAEGPRYLLNTSFTFVTNQPTTIRARPLAVLNERHFRQKSRCVRPASFWKLRGPYHEAEQMECSAAKTTASTALSQQLPKSHRTPVYSCAQLLPTSYPAFTHVYTVVKAGWRGTQPM